MEIWDSLNRRYLDFIKKQGAGREESWLFRGLREPGRGRAEELARQRTALGPGSGFLPKKGKAGKKCEASAGGGGKRRPRDGRQYGRLTAPGTGAVAGVNCRRSLEPRRARRRVCRLAQFHPAARRGPAAGYSCTPVCAGPEPSASPAGRHHARRGAPATRRLRDSIQAELLDPTE